MQQCAAIRLKIPDNEAYTTLTTLQRLGVEVAKLERTEIIVIDGVSDRAEIERRIRADEALFNPNKHSVSFLPTCEPREGEAWIEQIGTAKRIGWRLFDATGQPASRETVKRATEMLLCNPAIERAVQAK